MTNPTALEQAPWYVVHTKPRKEFRALEQLTNQHYECFLPTLQVQKIHRGVLEACVEPLFARYLFVRMDPFYGNDLAPIRSTRGVDKLVSFGGRFAMLPDICVEALRNVPQTTPHCLFQSGDSVSITSGPFAGLEGIYQAFDGEARALILIELVGQPQKLMFAVDKLRKTA
jgi:transcriptional antiterminator RfaH